MASSPAGQGSPAGVVDMPPGPPYLPQAAGLGGVPTVAVDDPICAVLLVLFLLGAAFNMIVFQTNRRRDHKFIMSVLLFGFCMSRIVTLVMRIVWASRTTNISVAIASSVFNSAGVLILFIVNLIFAQRLLRAYHPRFGWGPAATWAFRFLFFSIAALLVMVITATVYSFFTLDRNVLSKCRDMQLFGGTYLAVVAFLPIPIVVAAWALPRESKPEKFGRGRFRTKVAVVLFTSMLLAFGAAFRIGVSYQMRPLSAPAWFHHKAAFYCVNFAVELIVVYTYMLIRFDRRFHIPNGSSAPGHYSGGLPRKDDSPLADHINTEAEAFGDDRAVSTREGASEKAAEHQWDSRIKEELEKQSHGEPIGS